MNDITTKVCTACGQTKPLYEFHKHSRNADGYRTVCKMCRAQKEGHKYVKGAPPEQKWCRKCNTLYPATEEYFYKDENLSHGLYASCKNCHYERTRNWQRSRPEFWNSLSKKWRDAHPEKVSEMWQNWKQNNPEAYVKHMIRSAAYAKEWAIANPIRARINSKRGKAIRRARILGNGGSHTASDIAALYAEQEGRCAYCGVTVFWDIVGDIHVDHIIPLARGGANDLSNLAIACADCNLSKSKKAPDEWQSIRQW